MAIEAPSRVANRKGAGELLERGLGSPAAMSHSSAVLIYFGCQIDRYSELGHEVLKLNWLSDNGTRTLGPIETSGILALIDDCGENSQRSP